MDKPIVRDGMLLLLRAVLGFMFIAHGWDRFFITGLVETTGQFSAWNVPQPKLSAYLAASTELIGGALLVIGLLTTFVAGVLALLMACALYFVHLPHGIFVTDGGVEYTAVLVVSLLVIVVFGSGRASIDEVLS
ncbi:DoxX family protein [Corynebacterium epidermidicanis]|uniref:Putative membrane protein n=1 Tax=Corynebacterium epidermidicanis TaxID=1050174 RepID=A0A0G3GNB4_9CORY|nr:DoxX family protein [Corynebacterium epidermidicanis]AKK02686.1 putative membrane protein [Corynebacterium epidermidicanis]